MSMFAPISTRDLRATSDATSSMTRSTSGQSQGSRSVSDMKKHARGPRGRAVEASNDARRRDSARTSRAISPHCELKLTRRNTGSLFAAALRGFMRDPPRNANAAARLLNDPIESVTGVRRETSRPRLTPSPTQQTGTRVCSYTYVEMTCVPAAAQVWPCTGPGSRFGS